MTDNYKFLLEDRMMDGYLDHKIFSKAFCDRFNYITNLTKGRTMTMKEILEEEVRFLRKKVETLQDENASLLKIIDKLNELLGQMIDKDSL